MSAVDFPVYNAEYVWGWKDAFPGLKDKLLTVDEVRRYIYDFKVVNAEMLESLDILRRETDRLARQRYETLLDAILDEEGF